jgi:hypothetical protein
MVGPHSIKALQLICNHQILVQFQMWALIRDGEMVSQQTFFGVLKEKSLM